MVTAEERIVILLDTGYFRIAHMGGTSGPETKALGGYRGVSKTYDMRSKRM
jgi:hypothetical protein